MGLAPLAVLPECQRQGIGAQLVWHGLDECRRLEQDFVVVLGHPEYYRRFGFVPAASKNLRCEYPVPPEAFMVLKLRSGALENCDGLVKYGPEFRELDDAIVPNVHEAD
jgi:putative acetyltransferase